MSSSVTRTSEGSVAHGRVGGDEARAIGDIAYQDSQIRGAGEVEHGFGTHAVGEAPRESVREADAIVAVKNLGKCYEVYARPQDRLKQMVLPFGRPYYTEFWALRGVSFEVYPGDSVGILGRNGSGKSTLLQVIAGTLTPTHGEVRVRGRIAAMLELGSGFNTEFSGRENVFLLGSILGITRAEMEERFAEIAAFAEIGAFIEQPIKTYSSGMVARLAFAVAFSVEPDLMILDEILAVGDIGFQQKCLARLRQLRDRGLTTLFVSHSPDAVRSVCDKALFLDKGLARFYGAAERGTDLYLAHVREQSNKDVLADEAARKSEAGVENGLGEAVAFRKDVPGKMRYGTGHVQIERVEVLNEAGEACRAFGYGQTISVAAHLRAYVDVSHVSVSFLIRDMTGVDLMGTTTFDERQELPAMRKGEALVVRFSFENRLRAGNFGVSLALNRVTARDYADNLLFDQVDGCAAFGVIGTPERPIHYKFHQDVAISWEGPR